jgi:hypothetical protein
MPVRSMLLDVDASSPTDIWAAGYVGYQSGQEGKDHARVVHFDGTRWTTSLSLDADHDTFLSGVADLSPTDVWAVGGRWNPGVAERPMPMYWDGNRWERVDAPVVGELSNSFNAISALAPDLLIAAGTYEVPRGADTYDRSLSEEWDGTAWTVMP